MMPLLLSSRPTALFLSSPPTKLPCHVWISRRGESPFPHLLFESKRTSFLKSWNPRDNPFACSYKTKEKLNTDSSKKDSEPDWPIFERWDVPWKWQTVLLTMIACGVSFVLTGLLEASLLPDLGFQGGEVSLDEKAEILFAGQFSATAVVLGVLYGITNTFQPFPDDIFRYDLKNPFNLRDGWLLWSGIGFAGALIAVYLLGATLAIFNGEPPEREARYILGFLSEAAY